MCISSARRRNVWRTGGCNGAEMRSSSARINNVSHRWHENNKWLASAGVINNENGGNKQ